MVGERPATSIARLGCSTEGATHAQNTDDIFHACRQHCGADAACQRAISRSCHARAGGRASGISAIAKYRAETDLHVSEVRRHTRKHEISVWTVPFASARSRPVTAFQHSAAQFQSSPEPSQDAGAIRLFFSTWMHNRNRQGKPNRDKRNQAADDIRDRNGQGANGARFGSGGSRPNSNRIMKSTHRLGSAAIAFVT
jgi:hypothetical protein